MNKDHALFPVKDRFIYLNHCGISPLYSGAAEKSCAFVKKRSSLGAMAVKDYPSLLSQLHQSVARFLETSAENISLIHNTAEGLSMIASAYPFEKGDQVISYIHEYPSNYYPWALQKERGVELVLLSDQQQARQNRELKTGSKIGLKAESKTGLEKDLKKEGSFPAECKGAWSFKELEEKICSRTKMIAISHVQFTSGFAADLKRLGALCRREGIHLIVDAAQSLGCLPLKADEWGISAIAASAWKWLLAPLGAGLLYTSPHLREKLNYVMAGADLMEQGQDYLNHSWQPYRDGRRFQYSTVVLSHAIALQACFDEIFNRYGIEAIHAEIKKLQNCLLSQLDRQRFHLADHAPENRSAILSFTLDEDPQQFAARAIDQGVYISSRGGYLRIEPHFYNSEEEIESEALALNSL